MTGNDLMKWLKKNGAEDVPIAISQGDQQWPLTPDMVDITYDQRIMLRWPEPMPGAPC